MMIKGKFKELKILSNGTGGLIKLETSDGNLVDVMVDSSFLWAYADELEYDDELELEV